MRFKTTVIGGFASDVYRLVFPAGEVAAVTVTGDGDSDLDLYVRDEFGNLVAFDDGSTDLCIVRFCPRWTGWFTLSVVNRGLYPNLYTLTAS
jgi:hypothetical protein